MKQAKNLLFIILLVATVSVQAQVGIGTLTPLQKLDVNGAIKIGTTTTNQPGTIRFNTGKFEGGDGTNWKSFEALPSNSLVFSKTNPNTALQNIGYSYFGDFNYNYYDSIILVSGAEKWYSTSLSNPPQISQNAFVFWSGTEFLVWNENQFTNTGYKYNAVTDQWLKFSVLNAPLIANLPVWTGNELIVWGDPFNFNTPSKYNPSTNVWTPISNVNAPAYDLNMTSIWTGTDMIVFGGAGPGGRYNLSTNTWTVLPTVNAPSSRTTHAAVWTGTEMIIWGGKATGTGTLLNTGARYNPSTNTWVPIASTTLSGRIAFTAIWTGTEMVIMGGADAMFDGGAGSVFKDGAEYNPATNSWTPMVIPSTVYNIKGASAVWTGTEIIYWGGFDPDASNIPPFIAEHNYGARYNPATNNWSNFTQNNNIPTRRLYHSAAWNGNIMMVFGGRSVDDGGVGFQLNSGGRYFLTGGSSITEVIQKDKIYLYLKN